MLQRRYSQYTRRVVQWLSRVRLQQQIQVRKRIQTSTRRSKKQEVKNLGQLPRLRIGIGNSSIWPYVTVICARNRHKICKWDPRKNWKNYTNSSLCFSDLKTPNWALTDCTVSSDRKDEENTQSEYSLFVIG